MYACRKTAGPWVVVCLVWAVSAGVPASAPAPASASGGGEKAIAAPHVPDEILIKFKEGTSPSERDGVRAALEARRVRRFRHGIEQLKLGTGLTVGRAVARYRGDPRVEYVEPNYLVSVDTVPDDPRFPEMYALRNTGQTGGTPGSDIDAESAWAVGTGQREVMVAVIDTGIDYTHPDLVDNIWVNPGEIPGNHVDDDGNGFVDDVHGWDFVNHHGGPLDDNGHGTHVAGTIGAVGDNGIGVTGVNWKVSLVPVKFLDRNGNGSTADAIAAIEYASLIGAEVANCSWGGDVYSQALLDTIRSANDVGLLIVAAAGNYGSNNDLLAHYPSSYDAPGIVAVAATDHDDRRAYFSNFGATSVDLAAPGVDILSTLPGGVYGLESGTSMAAPHVSGAAALILSVAPHLGVEELKALLLDNVDPVAELAGITVTGGRLNAFRPVSAPDEAPPGRIEDLAAEPTSSTVILRFTATGDDGNTGRARAYDVRYSRDPLDETSFQLAPRATGLAAPLPAGSPETVEIAGLEFDTTYYLAVKAEDDWGNQGPVSNAVVATTLPPPTLASWPDPLDATALFGDSTTATLFIENEGAGTLDWTVGSAVEWITATPAAGRLDGGQRQAVTLMLDARGRDVGTHDAVVTIRSNDPLRPEVDHTVNLTVVGAPKIVVKGEPVTLTSSRDYFTSAAETIHELSLPAPPAGGGTFELVADGDYYYAVETATATAEGVFLGVVGGPGTSCSAVSGSFPVSAADLAALAADNVVTVNVQNSYSVNGYCEVNRHTVTLRYESSADRLDYGSSFVGSAEERSFVVVNEGSEPLAVSSISTDRAELTPSVDSLSLAPGASQDVTLTLVPLAAGEFSATVTLVSDDPRMPVVSLPVTAVGIEPPIADVDPTSIELTLHEGEQAVRNLTIANGGAGDLDFSLGIGSAADFASGFGAADVEFEQLPDSPVPLTSVIEDPSWRYLYGQEAGGNGFYRYDVVAGVWEPLAPSPLRAWSAAVLNGKIYTTGGADSLGVYDVASDSWSTLLNPIGTGIGSLCSDGERFLYLAAWNTFARFDPVKPSLRFLAAPPLSDEYPRGLRFLDGVVYAHREFNESEFASYDVATDRWVVLPPLPAPAVADAAIDVVDRQYAAYGPYFGRNLYRYSIDAGTWSVVAIPFFSVGDGGMGWLGGARPGVYFVQGEQGVGFGRLVTPPALPLAAEPPSGTVPPAGSVDVAVTIGTAHLPPGVHESAIEISTNDPARPALRVPVRLTVTGAPEIDVVGGLVTKESTATYSVPGAVTSHVFRVPERPASSASGVLTAEGDYRGYYDTATAVAEGLVLGSVRGPETPCSPISVNFTVPEADLEERFADGLLEIEVRNSSGVDVICTDNRHTVRLTYRGPAELDFGRVFTGMSATLPLEVFNRGSDVLEITSVSPDTAEFSPSRTSFSLPPGSSQGLTVTFAPSGVAAVAGELSISSNDPQTPVVTIPLAGEGLAPPVASVSPELLDSTLVFGTRETRTLTIANSGGSALEFHLRGDLPPLDDSGGVAGNGRETDSTFGEPEAVFERLADSPRSLTCVVEDPDSGYLYAQAYHGAEFYRYVASANTWEPLAPSPVASPRDCGAALLGGKVYTSQAQGSTVGVYDIASDSWSTIPYPLNLPTANIASDGVRYLYFFTGSSLERFDPESSSVTTLASPPFSFGPRGGLRYLDGILYGHTGISFGAYTVATDSWAVLPSLPAVAVQGAAIDPVRREYVAYGPTSGTNLYRFSIASGTWSVSTIPFFSVHNGGMGWLPHPTPGIYLVQGESASGLARLVTGAVFSVGLDPPSGTVAPGDSLDVEVAVDSAGLLPGLHGTDIEVTTNDPEHPSLRVPVRLTVVGAPRIAVFGPEITLESSQDFSSYSAVTSHALPISTPPAAGGRLDLEAQGRFRYSEATVTAEGLTLGSVGDVGTDCEPASGSFLLSRSTLAALVSDDVVEVEVRNEAGVSPSCETNRHAVRLTYPTSADPVDFGSVFVGGSRTLALAVLNEGTAPLEVTSITSDRPGLVPGAESMVVPPGLSRALEVTLRPSSPGPIEGTLRLQSNDPERPDLMVSVIGEGLEPPVLQVSPGTLESTLPIGGRDSRVLTVSNAGGNPLEFSISARAAAPLHDPAPEPVGWLTLDLATGVVPPSGSVDVGVSLDAAGLLGGSYMAEIVLSSNDPVTPVVTVPVRLEAVGIPDIAVGGEFVTVESLESFTYTGGVTTHALGLDQTPVGAGSVELSVVGNFNSSSKFAILRAEGTLLGTVGGSESSCGSASGTFALTRSRLAELAADGVVEFEVRNSSYVAYCSTNTHTVRLSYRAPADVLDFGSLFVGDSRQVSLLIDNAGTGVLTVASITSDRPEFSASASSLSVPPGGSRIVDVTFDPSDGGTFDGMLGIASNDPDTPVATVALRGTGTPPPVIAVSPERLDATAVVGTRATEVLTISNLGTSDLEFSIQTPTTFVTLDVTSGTVPASGSVEVTATLDPAGLTPGSNAGDLEISSNDPVTPVVTIPVALEVLTAPDISASTRGEGTETLDSQREYTGSGARTTHFLEVRNPPPEGVSLLLVVAGDFGDGSEIATVVAEGRVIGQIGAFGRDCRGGSARFDLSADDLAALAADGVIEIEVRNSNAVNDFCDENYHRVTFEYAESDGILRFPRVFTGASADLPVRIRNAGTSELQVTSITSDVAAFVASPTSLTIAPGTFDDTIVRFTPATSGSFTGSLAVASNDPDTPVLAVPVVGFGQGSPVMRVDPGAFHASSFTGGLETRSLTITNDGESTLGFTVDTRPALSAGAAPSFSASTVLRGGGGSGSDPNGLPEETSTATFDMLASSPARLCCVVEDLDAGAIYAQQYNGTGFYRYDAATDTWETLASAPTGSGILGGGAALLDRKIFLAYAQDSTQLTVYDIASDTWTTIPHPLGVATGCIASDGERLLFLAEGLSFVRFDPTTGVASALPEPPFRFGAQGGLRYWNGVVYGHRGSGFTDFARFDVASDVWSMLPGPPNGPGLGATIDPANLEYFAPSYGSSSLYRYSITKQVWSGEGLPFSLGGYSGMGWLPEPPGVYVIQGSVGQRFTRLRTPLSRPSFLSVKPSSGAVPPFGTQTLQVEFTPGTLPAGAYSAEIVVDGNDPSHPRATIAADLTVVEAPDIELAGEEVMLSSEQSYATYPLTTLHPLATDVPPVDRGWLEVTAEGDYGSYKRAVVSVEQQSLGSVEGSGNGCRSVSRVFAVNDDDLLRWAGDGVVEIEVGTQSVTASCPTNRHTVVLRYRGALGSLEFGTLFVGSNGEKAFDVINRGARELQVTSISSDAAEFSPSLDSLSLAPGASTPVRVRFAPPGVGDFEGSLTIRSNDPDSPVLTVPLCGTAQDLPEISVAPVSVEATLHEGERQGRTLTLSNSGNGPLEFTVDVDPPEADFVEPSPGSGSIPPSGSQDVAVLLDGAGLALGSFDATIRISSNDPSNPLVAIPVHLNVVGLPDISLSGPSVVLESTHYYASSGATTFHELPAIPSPVGSGALDLVADGNYFLSLQTATAVAEGLRLGSVWGFYRDCAPASRTFAIGEDDLASLAADGVIHVEVQNSAYVQASCAVNSHTVRLRYQGVLDPLGFGTVFTGFDRGLPLTVENRGTAPLEVTSVSSDDPAFAASPTSLTVAPGTSETVLVSFAPQDGRAFDAVLDFHSNDPDQPLLSVHLTGEGRVPPVIGVAPPALEASVPTGGEWLRTLAVSNGGGSALEFEVEVQPAAPSGSPVLSVEPSSGSIAPGQTRDVAVRFDATAPGRFDATLSLHSNDPATPVVAVPVGLDVYAAPDLVTSAGELDFGTVFAGFGGSLSLVVSNDGLADLDVTAITADASEVTVSPATATIPEGESVTVQVTYAPVTAGTLAATLSVFSNDPRRPLVAVGLHGEAIPPPHAGVAPASVVAALPPGSDLEKAVNLRISNTGGSDLAWSATSLRVPSIERVPGNWSERPKGDDADLGAGDLSAERFGGPDAFGYAFKDSDEPGGPPFEWVEISSLGTPLYVTGDDQNSGPVPLGFDFPFYGNTFDTVNVCSNGWLSFTARRTSYSNPDTLPDAGFSVPENLLAPFWDDLHLRGERRITYQADGSRFVVQFTHVDRYSSPSDLTFEVVLYPNGRIVFQYLSMSGTLNSATVGVQNGDKTSGLLVGYNTSYVHDGLAIEFGPVPAWLGTDAVSGVVPAGESRDLPLELRASGLADGDYRATLFLRTNDPTNGVIEVPVTLHARQVELDLLDVVPKTLNLASNGQTIQARLQLPPEYDPHDVVIPTVSIYGSLFANPSPVSFEDDTGDGIPELAVKFDRATFEAIAPEGLEIPVVVTGEVADTAWFTGTTTIRAIRPRVTFPNGAERMEIGDTVQLSWEAPEARTESYDVVLSRDGGGTWEAIASAVTASSLTWTVAGPATREARLRVFAAGNRGVLGYDTSDADFEIAVRPAPPGPVTTLRIGADDTDVVLTWEPPVEDPLHGPAQSYRVFRAASPLGPFVEIATTPEPVYRGPLVEGGGFTAYEIVPSNSGGDAAE